LIIQQNETETNLYVVKGKLNLQFDAEPTRPQTCFTLLEQQPPLRVIRAFELAEGGALVHLHNLSGGILGGDQLELKVTVEAGAKAQLTGTSATRIYRSRGENLTANQLTEVSVGENALLEFLAEPIIPFAGSRYQQQTRIELAPGAGLFWWETVAPGREAKGEVFEYDLFQSQLDLSGGGKLLALERLRLEPKQRALTSPARLGPYRYFSTFYICRVGLEATRWRTLENELNEIAQTLTQPGQSLWGVSTLPAHGLVVRALCQRGREIAPGLLAFWKAAKLALYGQVATPPRKIY
jgi:urease accessory protein